MTESALNNFSTLMVGEEGHTTSIVGEEDLLAHAETERKLQPLTTLALGEEVSTFAIGEEITTQALGEEIPTTTSSEESVSGPSVGEQTRRGGPFGAY